jgi:hypothetical protein
VPGFEETSFEHDGVRRTVFRRGLARAGEQAQHGRGSRRWDGARGATDMTLCPIALAAGCKKCPAFSVCPLKSVIGDQPKASTAATAPPSKDGDVK